MQARLKKAPCVKRAQSFDRQTFVGGVDWAAVVEFLTDQRRSGQITLHVDPQGKIGDVDWTEAK